MHDADDKDTRPKRATNSGPFSLVVGSMLTNTLIDRPIVLPIL